MRIIQINAIFIKTKCFFSKIVPRVFLSAIGRPTVNFGPLLRGQPHSPDVNHIVLSMFSSKGEFDSLTAQLRSRIWLFICCKTKLKGKIFFLKKYLCFLQNIHNLQKKKCFYMEKSFILKTFFTEKSFF